MYEQLPPLKTLRFFESVARQLSFSKAAEELFVSQSAVSYQIRRLEQFLGRKLFIRQGKVLNLSNAGREYYPVVQRTFNTLNALSARMMGQTSGVTRFLVYSSFAIKWLVPRLAEFRKLHPELDLRLEMNSSLNPDLELQAADCGISINMENDAYHYTQLISEEKIPVISSRLYHQYDNKSLDELISSVPLLDSEHFNEWQIVFNKLNMTFSKKQVVHYYSHTILMYQAAIEGQGIALCAESIVKDDIESGRLVRLPLKSDYITDFYFCVEKERFNEIAIQSLRNWLKSCF